MIVGAGLSGLVAAQVLKDAGVDLLVVDKGRSVGGRLATRRIGSGTLDHGAQFFTVRSADFRQTVGQWEHDGLVSVWCEGFEELDGYPRYRVNGGMSQLAKYLARDLDVVTGVRAQAVLPAPEAWTVTYEGGSRHPDDGAAVLLTAPVPQSLELLASGGVRLDDQTAGLADIRYHKVIALLIRLEDGATSSLPEPGARQSPDDPTFSFIADNQRKGISDDPALTFHTAHQLSAELWDMKDNDVRERLLPEAVSAVGTDAFAEVQVKRWRYSGPVTPWPERCQQVAERPGPLVLAGDAFGGPKVEGAFLSGLAAGEHLRQALAD